MVQASGRPALGIPRADGRRKFGFTNRVGKPAHVLVEGLPFVGRAAPEVGQWTVSAASAPYGGSLRRGARHASVLRPEAASDERSGRRGLEHPPHVLEVVGHGRGVQPQATHSTR